MINGYQQDFSSSLYNHKMIPGCQELKKVDPCANHKCKNGKCTPRKGDTYKCRCRQGYSGEWCDIGKQHFKTYFEKFVASTDVWLCMFNSS